MSRADTTQIDLLGQVLTKLKAELGLEDNQCFLAWSPRNPDHIPRSGEWFVTVSPGAGQFEPGEQVPENVSEDWTFDVTIYLRSALDRADEAASALIDVQRGLFLRKHQVLAAMVGWDLDLAQRALVHCLKAGPPQPLEAVGNPHLTMWSLTLTFALPFDWDLS